MAFLACNLHKANGVSLAPSAASRLLEGLMARGDRLGVARLGRMTAGYALWRERRRGIYLRHFVVRPDLRRRGIGRAFARLLLMELPGNRPVFLHTRRREAQTFWTAVGFRPRLGGGLRYDRNEESAR
ncbi:MAG: GNAT family N-acetyltransferase [Pseudomonadota bacterium]